MRVELEIDAMDMAVIGEHESSAIESMISRLHLTCGTQSMFIESVVSSGDYIYGTRIRLKATVPVQNIWKLFGVKRPKYDGPKTVMGIDIV